MGAVSDLTARWFSPKCPVRTEEQQWIEQSLHWLRAQFGGTVLHNAVVPPSADFFPDPYDGTPDDVGEVLQRVCRQLAVDPTSVELELLPFDPQQPAEALISSGCDDAATRYRPGAVPSRIAVRGDLARTPVGLVAALAHQVGHVQLLRERRITSDLRDHEPLTDLLVVYFGLGVFAANAAFHFQKRAPADPLTAARGLRGALGGGGYARRLGFMTEPMFGYALAYYTWLRDEPRPTWMGHLDTNPRVYMKRGLRYLRSQG